MIVIIVILGLAVVYCFSAMSVMANRIEMLEHMSDSLFDDMQHNSQNIVDLDARVHDLKRQQE